MATYVLIHGAGDSAFYWHLVAPELEQRGNEVVVVDLPCEDESAGLAEYADAVVEAIGDRAGLILVAHSLGGFTAPLVCARLPVELMVLVAAMVPGRGRRATTGPPTPATRVPRFPTARATTTSPSSTTTFRPRSPPKRWP